MLAVNFLKNSVSRICSFVSVGVITETVQHGK
jgi:hypothetical protein